MKLTALGEFGLISRLADIVRRSTHDLLVDIGDDAAVWNATGPQVATTDMLIEGVHFTLDFTSWHDLGWKSVAVNLSDLAAMGAQPRHILLAIGLPFTTEVDLVEDFYRGATAVADRFGAVVAGGDTVRSLNGVVISVTAVGSGIVVGGTVRLLRRSRAKVGDVVAVTGTLGASGAGLEMHRRHLDIAASLADPLRAAHLTPMPRVLEAQVLLAAGVEAAMDISDGLVGDLAKLATASGNSAIVDVHLLPVDSAVAGVFPQRLAEFALFGGEDYELLFTARPDIFAAASERLLALGLAPATVVGEIVAGPPGVVMLRDEQGHISRPSQSGYDAFVTGEQ